MARLKTTKEQAVTQGAFQPTQMVLCEDEGVGRIVVDQESFARFSSSIDAALSRLVDQWRHLMPPQPMPKRPELRRQSPK
jgi:hypothetical protein